MSIYDTHNIHTHTYKHKEIMLGFVLMIMILSEEPDLPSGLRQQNCV